MIGDADAPADQAPGFEVRLDNFEGPFDLLLNLIAKHKLDITALLAVAFVVGWLLPRRAREEFTPAA